MNAITNRETLTNARLALVSAKPDPPGSGSVKLYVRKPGADVILYAQLADATEVAIATLVSGGDLP